MKVLFLIHGRETPSSRVRVLDLISNLKKKGVQAVTKTYGKTLMGKLRMFRSCRYYDVVVVQKKVPTVLDSFFIRMNARKLIYDFDDAVLYRNNSEIDKTHDTNTRRLSFFLPKADLVIAGNRTLYKQAKNYIDNVVVIPSCIQVEGLPNRHHCNSSKFIVGWIGSTINLEQASLLAPVLQALSEKVEIEFRVISGRPLSIPQVSCKFIPWSEQSQYDELARLDAGVMPLPHSEYARGKCGYKALQYMSVGVPPVVSNVGVNKDIVPHKQCGFVADEIRDFEQHLLRLSHSADLRNTLGSNARARVKEQYSVQLASTQLVHALESVL